MDKYIFDGSNGLWYKLKGDYYFPCLTLPTGEEKIGLWGKDIWTISKNTACQKAYTQAF